MKVKNKQVRHNKAATLKWYLSRNPGKGEQELEWAVASWGMPYERQAPIGPWFADFLIKPLKLVIEVDGPEHGGEKDAKRDAGMAKLGYRVIRVPSDRAKANPKGVVNLALKTALTKEEYETRLLVRARDLAASQL